MKCLQGAVRDAKIVAESLRRAYASVEVKVLTSTTPTNLGSGQPLEEASSRPTYNNFVSRLRHILETGKPNDSVYIHYSGYGTRSLKDASSNPKSTEMLSLVLLDDGDSGVRYLRGYHLARALQRMVEKGLVVTLVLDCCFARGVVRDIDCKGVDIRSVEYDIGVDTFVSDDDRSDLIKSIRFVQDAKMKQDWLIDPDGYTILSACGPSEVAYEIEVDGGNRRGALTHLLFQELQTAPRECVDTTCRSLHERLCARFHASWPQQTPMCFGNRSLSVFGLFVDIFPVSDFIPIYMTEDEELRLCAGTAHGICRNDEFVVCSSQSADIDLDTAGSSALLKAETVNSFESNLIPTDPSLQISRFATSSKVRRVTCASSHAIEICLLPSVSDQSHWKQAATHCSFLRLLTTDERAPYLLNVMVNKHDHYEIVDALHCKVPGVPTVHVHSHQAIEAVLTVLQHLATFKYLEGLDNRLISTTLQKCFNLTVDSVAETSGVFRVKHGSPWSFSITNTSEQTLYLAILDSQPSWEIVNRVSSPGGDEYLVIPPSSENSDPIPVPLRMEVPEFLQPTGHRECEDVLKVIVTNRPVSFVSMSLPKIRLDADAFSRSCRSGADRWRSLTE